MAPNYEYGQSAVRWFKESCARPDAQFVAEQFPALGRIDAGATVQALLAANPDAIFNATFGTDLTSFVRQARDAGPVRAPRGCLPPHGKPEYLLPDQDERRSGWIVTGYPFDQLETPAHVAFRGAYRPPLERRSAPRQRARARHGAGRRRHAPPGRRGTEPDAMVEAMRGMRFAGVFGEVEFRALDHQSTMGAFVGRTVLRNGRGAMVDWRYADGRNYLPADEVVRQLRPQA